jgi:P4 family phage/plasmid primase-like protien
MVHTQDAPNKADGATVNGEAARHGPPPGLLPHHLADLRRSGLSDGTIRTEQVCSVEQISEVARVLGCGGSYARSLGPCLKFPFFGPDGHPTGYARLKPDHPQRDRPKKGEKEGRLKKYEAPRGQGNRAYFPSLVRRVLADPAVPLVLTEGEKKSLAACQAGFPTVGVSGVWNWCKARPKDARGRGRGPFELIDDLAAVVWQGRQVTIVFDSDLAEKEGVQAAQWHFAEVLRRHGALVRAVTPPAGPPGEDGKPGKAGLDDFLVAHGARAPEALRELLAAAGEPEKPPPRGGLRGGPPTGKTAKEAMDDPHRLARLYLKLREDHPDRPTLLFYRERFWRWNGARWCDVPDAEQRGALTKFCKRQLNEDAAALAADWTGEGEPPKVPKVTTGLVTNVLQALSGEVLIPQATPQPSWLDAGRSHPNHIAMANGLLDVDAALADRADCLRPHTPLWFSPIFLPHPFDLDAQCPRWDAFLRRNFGLDSPEPEARAAGQDKVALLQQFAGYLLLPDTSKQRFLLMLGDGANGKSVICAALRALLGEDNVSSVPLELFGEKFHLSETLGKLANVVAEVGELDRVAEGQLKAFVSGDPILFEQKFKAPFTARPTARLVLATNNVPAFSDKTDGLWRRMLLLKLTVQIPEGERVAGMDSAEFWRDAGEVPGIFLWSLAGLAELRQRGGFLVPRHCREDVEQLRAESNPARRFLQESYEEGPGEVPVEELYAHYRDWCERQGHHPLASTSFGKEVARRFKGVEKRRLGERGARYFVYAGLVRRED